MKKQSVLFLIVMIILAMLFLAACGGSSTPTAEPTALPAETVSEEPTAAEPTATTESSGDTGSEATTEPETGSDGPTLDENGIPTDVPMMDAFYDLSVEGNSTRIIYKVDGTNQDVVAFYTSALLEAGWDQMLGADSTIGALGTMGRQNANKDKLTINLSFNPNGNFVSVVIDIFRAK